MPLVWVPTARKRLMLRALNVTARIAGPLFSRSRLRSDNPTQDVRSILVIEPWNIGDIILAIPFLSQLRVRFPGARVSLLAQPHASEILDGTGLVDDFIPARITWGAGATSSPSYPWRELWRLRKELRKQNFDLGFSCRLHVREHVLLAISGARRRVGYGFGKGYSLLTDPIAVDDPHRQKVDDWLRLLEPFGGARSNQTTRLRVSESESARAREFLASRGIAPNDVLIGIHPGASVPEKRWPLESFRAIAAALAPRADLRVLIFVEPSSYGESLAGLPGAVSAKVGLRDFIALIERCDLLVCNDSGPMHIAGALDVPTVAVFGSGIDEWFSPLGRGHEIVAADRGQRATNEPYAHAAIRSPDAVPVSAVLDAVSRALHRLRLPGNFSPT